MLQTELSVIDSSYIHQVQAPRSGWVKDTFYSQRSHAHTHTTSQPADKVPFHGKSRCPPFTVDMKSHSCVSYLREIIYHGTEKQTLKILFFGTCSTSEEPVSGITCWQVFFLHICCLERHYIEYPLPLFWRAPTWTTQHVCFTNVTVQTVAFPACLHPRASDGSLTPAVGTPQ